MDRAFTVLQFRAVDDAARIIEGVASTDAVDTYGTVLEPRGAKYELPLPLLWQHDQESPVGEVLEVTVESSRIRIRARILKIDEAGPVKDTLDRAWQNVKHGLVRGLSVGFLPIKTVGQRFTEWSWRELSLVTLPATPGATIEAVRSAAQSQLAASGKPKHSLPGVSGSSNPSNPRHGTMTIQEQITQHENSRAAKVAARDALLERSAAEGRTLDASESESFDTLDGEIRSIDAHLVRLNSAKKDAETRAAVVSGGSSVAASQSRSGTSVVTVKARELPPGIGFARHAMALAVSSGNKYEAAEYAKRTWGDSSDEIVLGIREGCVALQQRAAVAPGTTAQATFAAPLVVTNYINDFLDLLRPKTLIGRIQGLRHVPFNVSMPAQTAGGTYKWVGQGKWKPVTNAQYASVTLAFAKASGIIVLTEELVRMSTPSAEAAVRDELVKGAQAFLDVQFVDSTVAAVANVNPASITNGVTGTAASAATGAAARADIAARVAALAALGYPVNELVILMSESIAFSLGLALNAVGGELFPGLTAAGGSIIGIPVVTSQSVGSQIIVAHAPSILMADENGVEIDVSREASLQLDSAPTDPVDATATLTSLWQANLVALRVERWITWGKARSTAVDRITSAAYTGA
jgi:HK97 family phage major capsid protein/HK97 family phage prohead protease